MQEPNEPGEPTRLQPGEIEPLRHLQSALEALRAEAVPRMADHHAVDRAPAGRSSGPIKGLLLFLARPFLRRQAAFNWHAFQSIETLARQLDEMREAIAQLDARDRAERARVDARAEALASAIRDANMRLLETNSRLSSLDESARSTLDQIRRQVDDNIISLWKGIEEAGQRGDSMRAEFGDNVKALWRGVEGLGARVEVSRAESRDQTQGVWTALEQRWRDEETRVHAIQELHTKTGALEAELREVNARLIVATEQQAMLLAKREFGRPTFMEGKPLPRTGAQLPPLPPPTAIPRTALPEPYTNMPTPTAMSSAGMSERLLQLAYLRFQRQYRGDEADLRARQAEYLPVLRKFLAEQRFRDNAPKLLDLACGDGVFLDLAAKDGWRPRGVDINDVMADIGRRRGIDIQTGDALAYLADTPEDHFDAVTAFQFVEHLKPEQLMHLLKESLRVLRPGGVLVLETLNPHTVMAHKWFHMDLTHERLVFPEMLRLLMETAGYRYLEHVGIHPVADHERLAEGEPPSPNIARLNEFLFGPQDYYIVGRKMPPGTGSGSSGGKSGTGAGQPRLT